MAEFEGITPGLTAEREVIVSDKHVITFTKTPVLSTPMMINFMEAVSKDMVAGLLPPGYITVGYEVHVKHKAAALLGSTIKTWARLTEADGRKLLFDVRVTEGERIIGEGIHRRTIIKLDD